MIFRNFISQVHALFEFAFVQLTPSHTKRRNFKPEVHQILWDDTQ